MRMAIDAASRQTLPSESAKDIHALWFSRLARMVSHELGHCLGMAHCVYYACNMQGTAGMKEDLRQPPYLCQVCEAKVSHAISVELQEVVTEQEEWKSQRCEALWSFCSELEN